MTATTAKRAPQPGAKIRRFVGGSVRVLIATLIAAELLLHAVLSTGVDARGAPVDESSAAARGSGTSSAASRSLHLVIEDGLLGALGGRIPADFRVVPKSKLDPAAILNAVAGGDSLVWVGEGSGIPPQLWVGTFRPATSALAVTGGGHGPVDWRSLGFRKSPLSSAYIKPAKLLPYHNIDEEPRAEFLPLLEARDRFGQVVGYPGVLMHYYAPSSVRHRFAGSECFFFLFDRPSEALDAAGWTYVLGQIASRFQARLQLKQVTTDYASYRLGERVRVRARVANRRHRAASTEVRFYRQAPGEKAFREIVRQRRCPDAMSEADAVADFLPRGRAGLWTLRVEAWQDPAHAEELAIAGRPVLVDRRDIGIVLLDGELKTPSIVSFNGPSIRLDGQDGFWAGTNYTPPNSWWDWQWRDFRPLKVAEDFAAMRRTGYRLVRNWIDPVLDEQSLRAMDAAIYLAAQNGIVLELCAFTINQWVGTIGFERENGEHVSVDFAPDSNLELSFQHLALQREFLQVLAKRWRGAGNLIYDLSNEPLVKDPDPALMDKEVTQWQGIPKENGMLRNSLLFRRWAKEMTTAIRQAGGTQAVIGGHLGGGDNYLGNRDSQIGVWHLYAPPEWVGMLLAYMDPACSGRPLLLEEFGAHGVWNDEKRYDGDVHYALAAGAAGAMSYEWGISWLSPELNFWPPMAKTILHHGHLKEMRRDKASLWRVVGIFPAPSGFNWGSIYHGTPFPAAAAIALGRLGRMGQGLGRSLRDENVYVVVPTACNGAREVGREVTDAVRKLWQENVVFGIVQEDCLGSLPKSVRVVICPNGVTADSKTKIEELRHSGAQVFMGPTQDWRQAAQIGRIEVTGGKGLNLLTRRTVEGTLYSLIGAGPAKPVILRTEQKSSVALGINEYGMVHERANGVNLVEATGEVAINGTPFCKIERGRAILASDDGLDLAHSRRVRVLATEPTRITFASPFDSAAVLEEGRAEPLATFVPEAAGKSALDIDGELIRYVVRIVRR